MAQFFIAHGLLSNPCFPCVFWPCVPERTACTYIESIGPVADLAALYQSDFELRDLGIMGALNLLILGGALGLLGAWLAVSRHLAGIEPK